MKVYDWYITPEEYRIAEKNGIKRGTLEKRIRHSGWDKEVALTKPIRKKGQHKKWIKLAKENGISADTFRKRINVYGWEIEAAATIPPTKGRPMKYSKKIREELKKNGIKYHTFLKRIESGWDLKRAYTEKTWENADALAKGRETQREQNIGAYYEIDNIRTIMSANKNKTRERA